MFKKLFLIGLFIGLIALLVVGAVNRTMAKSGSEGSSQDRTGLASDLHSSDLPAQAGLAEIVPPEEGYSWGRGRQVTGAAGSEQDTDSAAAPPGQGRAAANEAAGTHEFFASGAYAITEADQQALLFMREEEKLAHDVYLRLYELWGKPVFQNISASEQAHTEAVLALMNQYGIPDPASSQPGVFINADLQLLYDQLVAQGSQSLTEALLVGAAIEEIDILDLQTRLAQSANPEIQQVFTNLLMGSENHLRAFTSMLGVEGGAPYQPQYLSVEAYQAIMAEAGAGNGQSRGAGNGRRSGP